MSTYFVELLFGLKVVVFVNNLCVLVFMNWQSWVLIVSPVFVNFSLDLSFLSNLWAKQLSVIPVHLYCICSGLGVESTYFPP